VSCGAFSVQQEISEAGFKPLTDAALTGSSVLSEVPALNSDVIGVISRDEYENIIGCIVGVVGSDGSIDVRVVNGTTRRTGLSALLDVAQAVGLKNVSFSIVKSMKETFKSLMFLGFTPSKTVPSAEVFQMSYDLAPITA